MEVDRHEKMLRVSRRVTSRHQNAFAETGVSKAQWLLLRELRRRGPASAAQLSEALLVSRQAVHRLAMRLADEGIVKGKPDPSDARRKLWSLTRGGHERLEDLDARLSSSRKPAETSTGADAAARRAQESQPASPPRRGGSAAGASTGPVRMRSFEVVRSRLLEAIEDGKLKPGSILPAERELALRMEVGRPVVREALRSLESSGALEILPGSKGGARVRKAGGEGLRQSVRTILALGQVPVESLLEMRSILLSQSARLAAVHGTQEDFEAIEDSLARFELALEDDEQMTAVEPAIEFYRLTGAASRNQILALLMETFADLVFDMLAKIGHWPKTDSLSARRSALAAMRNRDAEEAERIMRTHSENSNAVLAAYKVEHG